MSIPEILRQLDAEIARLKQARSILASIVTTDTLRSDEVEKSTIAAKRRRAPSPERQPRIAAGQRRSRAVQQVPVVTVLPPVVARRRRVTANAPAAKRSALTSSIPTGPVAVRASEIKAVNLPAPVAAPQSAYSFLMGTEAPTS